IFTFSKEEGTHAATLADQIPEEVKKKRLDILAKTQNEMVQKRNKKMVGKTLDVVVEGYHPESKLLMRGRFYGQCPDIDGTIIINDTRKVKAFGKAYKVKITDFADYDLIGSVV